jgi:hypothetical protein
MPGHSTSSPRVVGNRELVPPTRRCVAACGIIRQWISGSTSNSCVVSCAMFSWFVTLPLFLIPTTDTSTDSPSLCWQSDHLAGRNKTALRHSGKFFPGLLQRPPATLEAVYWCRRKLFRRRSSAPECSTPCSFLYRHMPTFRAQFVNVGWIVQFMDTRQTLWLKVEAINHKPIAFKTCQIFNCLMTHQVPPCFVHHCSTNATSWGATERQNTRVAAGFESEKMNCDSKQTGLLILSRRCVELPQRRTSERMSFLQQSKQLWVELQRSILCSGGHSLRYNQHITTNTAQVRTFELARAPFNSLFVLSHSCSSACHVANRTVTTTALLSKRQF